MRGNTHLELLLTREEIRAFEAKNHVSYMCISHFSCSVDLVHVYFVLACKKSKLGEELLFQVNLHLLKHFVDKIEGNQCYELLIILLMYNTNTRT